MTRIWDCYLPLLDSTAAAVPSPSDRLPRRRTTGSRLAPLCPILPAHVQRAHPPRSRSKYLPVESRQTLDQQRSNPTITRAGEAGGGSAAGARAVLPAWSSNPHRLAHSAGPREPRAVQGAHTPRSPAWYPGRRCLRSCTPAAHLTLSTPPHLISAPSRRHHAGPCKYAPPPTPALRHCA